MGPDKIPNSVITNLPDSIIRLFVSIYYSCLALDHFPEPWKLAKIVTVLKSRKIRYSAIIYRPIRLFNTISKTFEKLVLFHILEHFRERGVLNNDQFGFAENNSTVQQLVRVANTISTNFHRRYLT